MPYTGLTLEHLPFAAALIDGRGTIVEINSRWEAAHPGAPAGCELARWCEALHSAAAELRDALISGTGQALGGSHDPFTQHYDAPHPLRILVAPLAQGALVFYEDLRAPDAPGGRRDLQAHKMETVGRLVGGVVHDFANLLTLIAGYSDILLSRAGENDPLRPELDQIRKAAERGARLTGQLLGFTRGRAAEARPLDLNALIAEMARMLRPILGESVDLAASLAPDLGRVMADAGQMEQVIMNLVLNARDAMPAGGRICIETCNAAVSESAAGVHGIAAGPCVLLSISDTGHGIDPKNVDRVFQPFFTTKEEGKGTGLGLTTVQNIVKQSGGDVWVRSAPGEGASFTLCLPRIELGAPSAAGGTGPSPESGGSETVLLAEDEDAVRSLLAYVLRKRGYRVLEARSGEEALAVFQDHGPGIQLVLTDMVMPGMSGRELGERVREIRPDMRVIHMSGYTDDELVRTGALGPGMSFLAKPLGPEVLAAKVREALDSPSLPFNPA